MESGAESGGTDAGDRAEDRRLRLSVPTMDCPTCAQKVESNLTRLDGVDSITLLPTTGTVSLTYDPTQLTEDAVVSAIESAGYSVADRTDGTGQEPGTGTPDIAPPTEVWTSPRAILTWIGAVAVAAGLLLEFVLVGANVELGELLGLTITLASLLFLLAIAVSGVPVLQNGYYSLRSRRLDIDLLMGTAIVVATGIGYFVEAATLAVLFSIAELLEQYAMDRARDSLRELMALSPERATVRRDGEEVTVPADAVEVGETVLVRPGEKIPLDGAVTEGDSAVDESPITGESVPVDKTAGDQVFAGSINKGGYLEVEVTAASEDSTLARIIDLVERAQETKTETERFVDRFAGYYTPIVVGLAILTAAIPSLVLGWNWQTWLIRGLTLLVIACPCAFVISTPVSVVSGLTSAAKNGVLIKGGTHLEAMGAIDAIALDKTGTLTKGELAVTDVVPAGDTDRTELLSLATALEQRSEHPIAEAIQAHARDAGIVEPPTPSNFETLPGKGVKAEVDGETIYVGNPALFESQGVDLSPWRARTDGEGTAEQGTGGSGQGMPAPEGTDAPGPAEERGGVLTDFEQAGKSVVMVGTADAVHGVIAIADEVRPEAAPAIQQLRDLGVEPIVMLTGDNEGTARTIAAELGIDDYRAGLLPEDKVTAVESLQAEYGTVAMVGDGINDAPALATADVGIAMGAAGTDTAIETADIALMADDIGTVPYLFELSRRANSVIRQNIWTSLGVKALLAIGIPFGYVSMAIAVVVGDMGMSLGVTGNALRLSRIRPDRF